MLNSTFGCKKEITLFKAITKPTRPKILETGIGMWAGLKWTIGLHDLYNDVTSKKILFFLPALDNYFLFEA
ncbi:MAG: hypothetical protein KBD43_14660 [Saprospiraceae bacterium]|nr:hypothetical protein [Saprospiraceae bacterium]